MISSITSYLFGASSGDGYSASKESCSLHLTAADDEWMIVDRRSSGAAPVSVEKGPMEDLLIAHPSMSVYGTLAGANAPAESAATSASELSGTEDMANAVARVSARACVAMRSEPYNLRKTAIRKSQQKKKETTRRAFNRANQTTHNRKHSKHNNIRPSVVFQPRK